MLRKHYVSYQSFPVAHLGKHCCGNKICFPNKFRNIFVAETMFPGLPTCFQVFPARETLFSLNLDMCVISIRDLYKFAFCDV